MTTSEQLNNIVHIIQAQEEITRYNDELDMYIASDLVRIYAEHGISVIDNRISCGNVIRAASLYNTYVRERFGMRAYYILYDMIDRGYDVRMDMQSYKLVWKGVYNNG